RHVANIPGLKYDNLQSSLIATCISRLKPGTVGFNPNECSRINGVHFHRMLNSMTRAGGTTVKIPALSSAGSTLSTDSTPFTSTSASNISTIPGLGTCVFVYNSNIGKQLKSANH